MTLPQDFNDARRRFLEAGRVGQDAGRGVLRQQVPHWLSLPDLRELIVGYEAAAIRHGGDGALYVRLRRAR